MWKREERERESGLVVLRIQVRENALDVHSVTDVAAASNGLFQVDVHKAELELLVRVLQRLLHVRYVQIPYAYR